MSASLILLLFLSRGRNHRRNCSHWDCHSTNLALYIGQSAGPVPPYWWRWTSSGGECQIFLFPTLFKFIRKHFYWLANTTEENLSAHISVLFFVMCVLYLWGPQSWVHSVLEWVTPPTTITLTAFWRNSANYVSEPVTHGMYMNRCYGQRLRSGPVQCYR